MDDFQPECIIVSNNRYIDLEPYCSYVYHHDPSRWDSIFPWEFPQNGTKDEEEKFLRRYFSKTEIYMQGFRFLKQVWYSIALYNLNQRVPAFTNWWLAKPSSIELLNDTKLQPFLFRQDVTPSTFFSDELPQYGEKFLSVVVPHLQRTAKELLQKREAEKKPIDTSNDTIERQQVSRKVSEYDAPKTDQSVDSAGQIVQTTVSLPSPGNVQQLSATEIPQSAPALMKAIEITRPQIPSNAQAAHQDVQPHPRKRGNSIHRRYNHRGGGTFSTRQATSFNQPSPHMYPSPNYGPTPELLHSHPRMPSGGPIEFMPALSQPQQLQPLPRHIQYMSTQYGHLSPIQQPLMPQDVQFAPGTPHPYFNHPFGDRSNSQQHPNSGFNVEQHVPHFHDPSSFRGLHRNNNQGSRGGKPPRGNYGARGKNSRGRNSFSSVDRPYFVHSENKNSKPFGDFLGNSYPHKNRRGSVIHETNWRSGSDNPQIQHNEAMMKENILPNLPFGRPGHHRSVSLVPQNQDMSSMSLPFDASPSDPSTHQAPGLVNTLPMSSHNEAPLHMIDPNTLTIDQTCNRTWIGKDCTYVDSLLIFDVPGWLDERQVHDFCSSIAYVTKVFRSEKPNFENANRAQPLVWVYFANGVEARKFFENKPTHWLGKVLLRVEVPRKFWDSSHPKYLFGPRGNTTRSPEEPKPLMQVASILRRPMESSSATRDASTQKPITEETQSTDVTPTPSGSSTPKKKKNNSSGKKHKAKMKEREDPRKTSLTANADQLGCAQNIDDQNEAYPALPITNNEHENSTEAIDDNKSRLVGASNMDNQSQAAVQTEIRTASEPAFSRTDIVETHLHVLQSAFSQPGSAKTDIQTTSELAVTPTNVITARLPEAPQPFRAEDEKAPAPDQDARAEYGLTYSPADDIKDIATGAFASSCAAEKAAPLETTQATQVGELESQSVKIVNEHAKTAATPCKVDDDAVDESFHTASCSLDSDKCAGTGNDCDSARSKTSTITKDMSYPTAELLGRSETVVIPASPDSAVSPKSTNRVRIPQLPMRSRLESVSSSSATKPHTLEPPPNTESAIGSALLTPAYFTAPNTPAVHQRSPEVVPEGQEDIRPEEAQAPQPTKKTEKSKGPAQTESFSLFGKRKEKKTKGSKKGTLKGKPKPDPTAASDVASDSTSRVASGAPTPNLDLSAKNAQGSTNISRGGEEMGRTDSKRPDHSIETPTKSHDPKTTLTDDFFAPLAIRQETPSKRKGFGSLISGLFSGGQQSLSLTRSDNALPSKNSLTDSKAQDPPPEKDVKKMKESAMENISTNSIDSTASHGETKGSKLDTVENMTEAVWDSKEDFRFSFRGGLEPRKLMSEIGLGISNVGDRGPEERCLKSEKKTKKKNRTKKGTVDVTKDEQSPQSVSESKTASWIFQMGKESAERSMEQTKAENAMETPPPGLNAVPPTVDEQDGGTELRPGLDDSEVSSQTVSVDSGTPSTDVQSPTLSGPAKRLCIKPPGHGHLVEAKDPSWKQKKRIVTPKKTETPPESEAGVEADVDDNSVVCFRRFPENQSPSEDYAPPKLPEKFYVYVGKGSREDDDGQDVELSREKLQELARKERLRSKAAAGM